MVVGDGGVRPHTGQFGRGRGALPEPFPEQDATAVGDPQAEFLQGLGEPVAEGLARAQAQDEVGGVLGGLGGGPLDETDPVGQTAGRGGLAAPGQGFRVDVDAGAGGVRGGGQDTEHELGPAAADVEDGGGAVAGEPAYEAVCPGLRQRAVESEPGVAGWGGHARDATWGGGRRHGVFGPGGWGWGRVGAQLGATRCRCAHPCRPWRPNCPQLSGATASP
ncbi:hypothetical protein GCM10010304_34700 [Streptomyces roseoviolaceus]